MVRTIVIETLKRVLVIVLVIAGTFLLIRSAPGDPAELLAIRATTVREAVASAPGDRLVFARGRLVARTRTETELTL